MTDPISMNRRRMGRMLAAAAAAAAAPHSFAQDVDVSKYPDRVIRVVNPWTPGGPADAVGRPIVDILARAWGQPVIMDNRPGANAVIGSAFVANSPPDGYTLLLGQTGPNTISPGIGKGTPYDPIKDFAPISQITSAPMCLAVRPDLPIRTVSELIAYGKANPGKLTYGSVGNGSTSQIAGEMLKAMGGFDMLHVPYKGAAPILTDMMGGQISMTLLNLAGIMPYVGTGKIIPVAVSTLKRSSFAPDVPTFAETLPGFEMVSWYALLAPAGTPKPIIDKIYNTVVTSMRTPEVAAIYRTAGQELELSTPQKFSETLRAEVAKWGKLVKEYKITADG